MLPGASSGDGGLLGKPPGPVHADNFHASADMALAVSALIAKPAVNVGFNRDKIPLGEIARARPRLNHCSTKLMAEHHGDLDAPGRPAVPLVNGHIRAADRGQMDLDEQFVG